MYSGDFIKLKTFRNDNAVLPQNSFFLSPRSRMLKLLISNSLFFFVLFVVIEQ